MKNFYNKIIKCSGIFMLVFFSIILLLSLFIKSIYICDIDTATFTNNTWRDLFFILLFIAFIIIFFTFIDLVNKIPAIISIFIYLLIGLLFIYLVPLKTFSDMEQIYSASIAVAHGNFDYFINNSYFSACPNNLFITLFYGLFLFIFSDSIITIKLLNIFLIIGIVFFSEKILQRICKNNYQNAFYIWALSCIPTFFYINHIYTDIPFIFFTLLCIWLYYNNPNNILICCFILAMVYQLRPQALFYTIAICIHYVFNYFNRKKILITAFSLILSFIIILSFNNIFVPIFIGSNPQNTLPVWSYIYMAFNEEEFGFQDQSHSPERNFEDVKERITELGPLRTSKIIIKKTFWIWSEGTYQSSRYAFGPEPVSPNDKYAYNTIITEHMSDSSQICRILLDAMMRAQYLVIFIFTLPMFLPKNSCKYSLFNLLFLANIIFYIFWEIKSRYILPLYPLHLIFIFYMMLNFSFRIAPRNESKTTKNNFS